MVRKIWNSIAKREMEGILVANVIVMLSRGRLAFVCVFVFEEYVSVHLRSILFGYRWIL